jgi:hypothetical protein
MILETVDIKLCKHHNYVPAGYKQEINVTRVQSLYHVYCLDCNHFINLLDGSNIDNMNLVAYDGGVNI